MSRDRIEFDVVGKDSGSKAFDDVGKAADRAADQVDDLGKAAKGAGDKVDKAGEQADDAAGEYRGLAASIELARAEMRRLAEEIDRTGNMDLAKDLRKQQSELRKLLNVQKAMGDAGKEGADAFGLSFSQRIGPLLAQAPLSPGLVAGAAAAAPLVANIVSGAVVGGISSGAVAAGIAIAARDPQVQAQAKGLAAEVGEQFKEAAQPFVPATIAAIGIVREEFGELQDDLEAIFADAAEYVEPLTRGAMGFVQELVPGIRDAVSEGKPFFEMLERELPELGADVGQLFSTMAEHSEDGAAAVGQMLDLMGGLADATGVVIDGLAMLKEVGNLDPTSDSHLLDELFGKTEGKFIQMKQDADGAADGVRNVGNAASTAAVEVETLAEMIGRLTNENISVEQANIALEAAIDRAGEAAKRNGDGIDANIPKQRANRQALIGIADAAWQAHDKILKTTQSQELASAATERGRAKFLAAADAMGVEKGEAEALANQLFGIPKEVKTKASLEAEEAGRKIKWLKTQISGIPRSIFIKAEFDLINNAEVAMALRLGRMSDGGRVGGSGPGGVDSQPRLLAPDEYVLRGPAARAIGYETLDRLNQADQQPVTLAGGGGGGSMRGGGGGADEDRLARAVGRALSGMTLVLDDRTGRTAYLQSRVG